MSQHKLLIILSLYSALVPLSATADEFSYIPSEKRKRPTLQYQSPDGETAAPVARPIKPIPKTAYYQDEKNKYYDEIGLSFEVKGGYRTDDLQWNIASDITGTATPNILSELTWRDVGSYQVEPKISYTQQWGFLKGLHFEGSIQKSETFSGKNQDSDYFGDARTAEFSRSNNDVDEGDSLGFSAAVGYAFDFSSNRGERLARFMTLLGYARQQQTFVMTNGFQTIPATGSFAGLNSTYEANWSAPFVGASVEGYFYEAHRLQLRGKYYRGEYLGEANWNLRGDFAHPKSFEHKADSQGLTIGAEYGWEFYPQVELTLSVDYVHFTTEPGVDTTFFSNGAVLATRLNEVDWESMQYMAGLGYTF